MHGEKKKISLADVRTASGHIRKTINKALFSKLYTKAELIQAVDECKLAAGSRSSVSPL